MKRTFLLLLSSSLLFVSCSSALKRKCESTNWFEYGESVAKRGQRTASDVFVAQCEKEEAKLDHAAMSQGFQKGLSEYCTPDFAYRLGKQGEFLSGDMCSGAMDLQMKPRHAAGVLEYCQPGNGESAGTAGKKYNQICPKELEPAFVPEFKKGRKKFLTGLIARKESEVQDISREVIGFERNKLSLRQDVTRLDYERISYQNRLERSQAADPSIKNEISQLDTRLRYVQREIDGLDRKINAHEQKQRALRDEIRDAQSELSVL